MSVIAQKLNCQLPLSDAIQYSALFPSLDGNLRSTASFKFGSEPTVERIASRRGRANNPCFFSYASEDQVQFQVDLPELNLSPCIHGLKLKLKFHKCIFWVPLVSWLLNSLTATQLPAFKIISSFSQSELANFIVMASTIQPFLPGGQDADRFAAK